jgi:hypothetical protein
MKTCAGDNGCRVRFENLIHLINQTKLAGESEGAQAEAPLQFPIGMLGECAVGYNEFDFCLDIEEYRPCDRCKIEI